MKIALVHDFFMYWGGAERVVKGLHHLFPDAPLYTLFYNPQIKEQFFPNADIRTSFLQRFPLPHRSLLPLLPTAVESLNLDSYDVLITSGIFSKGIITKPHATHIHYCHTPPRFLWEERNEYLAQNVPFGFKTSASLFLHWLRLWDRHASERVDTFVANSQWTRQRVKRIYGRDSTVIYPFHESYKLQATSYKLKNYFLIVSRLQQYKNLELPIKVLSKLKLPLYIVGEGPDRKRLERMAGNTVKFLGFKREEHLPWLYRYAKAVIVPSIEDFGLVPIEAMAHGVPVLAYRKGGARETILEGKTGEFFGELTKLSFWYGLERILTNEKRYDRKKIRNHAKKFSFERFKNEINAIIHHA